jgi:hypothetical protein
VVICVAKQHDKKSRQLCDSVSAMRYVLQVSSSIRKQCPTLSRLLRVLSQFPISWRKAIITFCQVGDPDFVLAAFRILANTRPITIREYSPNPLNADHFCHVILGDMTSSICQRSILWMFCRTSLEEDTYRESKAVALETFEKEFQASQVQFSDHQAIDWSSLYNPEIDRSIPDWSLLLSRTAQSFIRRINRFPILYPNVNRKKNVSQESTLLYQMYEDKDYVRTVDLEVLYGKTGIEIGGACEMRKSWKFNELKPRFYYCKSGKSHSSSKYMKPFAIALLESIPTTATYRRTRPFDYISAPADSFVVYWDYGAFTTTLGELKYFMAALANAIDGEAYSVRLFDYFHGVIEVPPAELLNRYNEEVNCLDSFWIHRVPEALELDLEIDRTYQQQNSGMLGVEGNIGFSMALHGAVIEGVVGDSKGVCVGDDGLGVIREDPNETLIPTLDMIGRIHPDKFGIIERNTEKLGKFLKRGFYRDANGTLSQMPLLDFPISVFIDEEYGDRTVPIGMDDVGRLKRIAIQVGQLLWQVHLLSDWISDAELQIIQTVLDGIYLRMGFSRNGSLISFYSNIIGHSVPASLPSLRFDEFDPRYGDWLEFLLDQHIGPITIPVFAEVGAPSLIYPGGEPCYVDESDRGFLAMEDMGLVRRESMFETFTFLSEHNKRKIRRMLGRMDKISLRRICEMHCIAPIPEKFLFLFCPPDISIGYMEISDEI